MYHRPSVADNLAGGRRRPRRSAWVADGSGLAQPRDLAIPEPESLAQHLVGVLAEQGRGRPHAAGVLREALGLGDAEIARLRKAGAIGNPG